MNDSLRILLIEDSPHDAELIERELAKTRLGFEIRQIQTERELREELKNPPDMILSDHGLPSFTGFAALEIVREQFPQLPFIFVSGSNDQAMVVEMFDLGATDYVFKGDIQDLDDAVLHALELKPMDDPPQLEPDPASSNVPPVEKEELATPGHLFFCPDCRQTRNESGAIVTLPDYLGSHQESIVVSRICDGCAWKQTLAY